MRAMDMGGRVWLVDDDPDLGVIVGVLCKRGGQTLVRFTSVEPAWQALLHVEGRPDLILLDVNLPGENGIELLRRRGADAGPAVALFCQPGLRGDIAAGWAAGADYLFAKDLVADPPAWQGRVAEILQHAIGSDSRPTLEWAVGETMSSRTSWGRMISRAVGLPQLRPFGGAVLTQVIRRCLVEAFGPEASDCVHPSSGRISAVSLARPATPAQARLVLSSFVDQATRLLGSDAGAAVERHLRAAWTGAAQ